MKLKISNKNKNVGILRILRILSAYNVDISLDEMLLLSEKNKRGKELIFNILNEDSLKNVCNMLNLIKADYELIID